MIEMKYNSSMKLCSCYLEVENNGPDETENDRWFALDNVRRINVDQFDLK